MPVAEQRIDWTKGTLISRLLQSHWWFLVSARTHCSFFFCFWKPLWTFFGEHKKASFGAGCLLFFSITVIHFTLTSDNPIQFQQALTKMSTTSANLHKPRSGLLGFLDSFVGPGATGTELALQFVPAFVAAGIASLTASFLHKQPMSMVLVSALLALDTVGGVLTNSTVPAKRWFHRPGQTNINHFFFVVIHALQLGLFAIFFRSDPLPFFLSVYCWLLMASLFILCSGHRIKRPVAMLLYMITLIGNLYFWKPTETVEWFLPVFFLKLLICHLLPPDSKIHGSGD